MAIPNSYDDPFWVGLAGSTEQKLGLPQGLLQGILLHGEKSNANQVSSAGASSPFQIIPQTAQAITKKYGFDPLSSPENSARGAGLLLQESLQRNKGSVADAIGEYIGGTNRANWGKTTKAYIDRVVTGLNGNTQNNVSEDKQTIPAKFNPKQPQITEQKAQSIFNAYINGTMDDTARQEYESDIQSGKVKLPFTADAKQVKNEIKAQNEQPFNPNNLPVFNPNQKQELPKSVVDAYNNGAMDAQARTELERDLKDGVISLPKDAKLNSPSALPIKLTSKQIDYINNNDLTYDNPEQANEARKLRIQNVTNDILHQNKSFIQKAVDNVVGAGETALSTATGLTTGTAGLVADTLLNGDNPNKSTFQNALTYQPKTEKGQEYTQNVGEIIQNSGIQGLAPELSSPKVGRGIAKTVGTAESLANKAKNATIETAQGIKETVKEATTKAPEPTIIDIPTISKTIDNDLLISTIKEAKDGSKKAKVELKTFTKNDPEILNNKDLGIQEILSNKKIQPETSTYIDNLNYSAGAMATKQETLRLKRAEEFNTPITKGEATRDRGQLQLETEDIGKSTNTDIGGKYETFKKQQENALQNNFDTWIDEKIGAKKIDDYGAGGEVKKALNARLDKEKAKTTQAYNLANASKEANQKVPTNDLVSLLNDNKVEAQTVGSVLDYAKRKLIATGGAIEKNGELVAQDLTRKDLELIRRSIGNEAQTTATNMYHGNILKKTIDKMTETIDKQNNGLYQKARMQKQLTAQKFENKSIVADLLAPKRTKGDAKIADEKVVQRIINAPVDDIKFIRNLLVNSGEEGKQGWKEVQAGVIRHIRDKSTNGVKGEISADKLNKVVTNLTKDEKLTAFLGKKGSEALNDFNQLVKDIKVLPNGISNASGTAHALQRMLQGILSKSSKYLGDTPILRIFLKEVEDKKLQRELGKALYYKG